MIASNHRLVLATFALAACLPAQEHASHDHVGHFLPAPEQRSQAWPEAVLDKLSRVPVQDGGRVKPLSTFFGFELLFIAGQRSARIPDEARFGAAAGEKLDPLEWGLDVWFFPAQARQYPVFRVDDRQTVEAIGLDAATKRKRDRYSLAEIEPAWPELQRQASQFEQIEEKLRTGLQGQIVHLAQSFSRYVWLERAVEFARWEAHVADNVTLKDLFDGAATARFGALLRATPQWGPRYFALAEQQRSAAEESEFSALNEFAGGILGVADRSRLRLLPPADEAGLRKIWTEKQLNTQKRNEWLLTGDFVRQRVQFADGPDYEPQLDVLDALAELSASMEAFAAGDAAPLQAATDGFLGAAKAAAEARDAYGKVDLEVSFYRADYFYNALLWFLFAFLFAAVRWIVPNRWIGIAAGVLMTVGTAYLSTGIVVRCLLNGRPPVTTLYETILFIAAVIAIVALVVELISRSRIALPVGAALGALGMFLSFRYEEIDKSDTIRPLIAVLDTNFWLATHVTTVTIGYAAGLLAGFVAYIWIFGKLFGLKRGQPGERAFFRGVGRMVYGVICFGLLFSLVGTILGGVWANDSWGRFWGWDPKENGALLIVLAELAILHARLGGFIRDFGVCMSAVALNIVVAFSWWGINFMGVGLHSYGFTAGLKTANDIFWWTQVGVLALGAVWWLFIRPAREQAVAGAGGEAAGEAG